MSKTHTHTQSLKATMSGRGGSSVVMCGLVEGGGSFCIILINNEKTSH